MRRVPARMVVAVLALAWVLASLEAPGRTWSAFFSPPSPFPPAAYLPAVHREYRIGPVCYLPISVRR